MNPIPVDHLSYSSMKMFCSNPWLFKKNYLLNIWDKKTSPSMLLGKAFHKYAEVLYGQNDQELASKKAYELLNSMPDSEIDWLKTGSREKTLKELAQVIDIFMSYRSPSYGIVKATEFRKTVTPFIDGKPFPLAIKAVSDMVTERDGGIHIIDWKVVSSHTDIAEEQPDYIMQAIFNYFTVKEFFGEPKTMTYVEVKKSLNKDGSPQIQNYEINYDKHPEYFKYFGRMYAGVVEQLQNPSFIFLPNFSDIMTKKEAWQDFTSEIMDFNMPEQTIHRSPISQNIERAFVESKIDEKESTVMSIQDKITTKMIEFGIPLEFVESFEGPNVTLFGFKPSRGVKMSSIENFDKDLQLALETKSVRIIAPIPGKKLVGVEIANDDQKVINLDQAPAPKTSLELAIGLDVYGMPHSIDLAKAPHLLVAGSTGAGKSVGLAGFIKTLTKNNTTLDLGLVLIDPKRSEFVDFDDCQHLLSPIVTETEDAIVTLQWAVDEMETRYKRLKEAKAKNIDLYNANGGQMQKIVIIVDELADLLLSSTKARGDIETHIVRLAQKARAVGIHLILATQRPSVDVVTGILKANFPTRLAFMTATQTDSKVIIDQGGAEKLIGNGDCLLMQPKRDLLRLQNYYTE